MPTRIHLSLLVATTMAGVAAASHIAPPSTAISPNGDAQEAGHVASSAYLSLLPDGEEKRRFILDCTGCHQFDAGVAFPGGKPRGEADWHTRVAQMVSMFGAQSGFPIIARTRAPVPTSKWLAEALATVPDEKRLALPPLAGSAAQFAVRSYDLPETGDLPHDLMLDRKGRVIITGMFTRQMYVLDPASGRFETVPIAVEGGNPRALHVDADDTWWVLLGAPKRVARRDGETGAWTSTDIGVYGHSIARDSSGVWFNGHFTGHPAVLGHVDLLGRVRRWEVPSEQGAEAPIPYELRRAVDGRIWMSELHGNRMVVLDPATGATRAYTMPVSASGPRRFDIADDGSLWIPLYAAGSLVRLDPVSGAMETIPLPTRDALPYVVRVDDVRGVVWVGTGASERLSRLTMKTRQWDEVPLGAGALIRHLDVDRGDGTVWAAFGASPGVAAKIVRVSPAR